jgi:hypothetical protein
MFTAEQIIRDNNINPDCSEAANLRLIEQQRPMALASVTSKFEQKDYNAGFAVINGIAGELRQTGASCYQN